MIISAGIINEAEVTIIDSYEDQNLNEYSSVQSGSDNFVTTSVDGTYAHSFGNNGFDVIYSTSGLDNYFSKGEEMNVHCYFTSNDAGDIRHLFGVTDTNDYYNTRIDAASNSLALQKRTGGGVTGLDFDGSETISGQTWYRVNIVWDDGTLGGSNNDITAKIYEGSTTSTDGTLISTLTANDSDHATESGIGMYWSQDTNNETVYTDYWHKP